MALVGREFKLFSIFMLCCLFSSSLLFSVQGEENEEKYEFRYPFIKRASTFSSATSSFASKGKTDNGGFDYIVVGGGTAGCPLAATLSQNYTVLLLERGGVPFSNANVSFLRNFHISLADTSPSSASQPFVSTDGVINSRARILGGGSSINAGFYTRANPTFIKKMQWDEKLVNESFPWIEKHIVYRPVVAPWQRAFRNSLLEAGISPYNGFTYDHMSGTKFGGTIFDRFGRRHTSAELLAGGDPQKLTVLIYATVQRVVFDTSVTPPKVVGVVFKDEHGNQHEALLNGRNESEVILSSGAIGTPQMLVLSGVGPKAELERLKIPVVVPNEFVGREMADNPMNSIFVPSNKPVKQSLIQTVGITKFGVYIEASSGFGQSRDSIRSSHGLMSSEDKKPVPKEMFQGGFILEKIADPLSTGHLSVLNTDPDVNPNITFNYFSHPSDLRRCVDGVKVAIQVAQSHHFSNFSHADQRTTEKLLNLSVTANINLVPRHPNATHSFEQFCKDTVITIWHYHGGAHVGKVVNDDYRVLGVTRLRVIDGSVFTASPGTNPQATVMMMGRYMGVKILRERLGKAAGV